jgi:hypothetical protein
LLICTLLLNNANFTFNLSTDAGSNYNVTKTTTFFQTYHTENGAESSLLYQTTLDLAQSTAFQTLTENGISNQADASLSGSLTLFNPSSTTYVKHFIANNDVVKMWSPPIELTSNFFVAGYGNTTSAVNAIQFKMSSGNTDAGTIYMYGIK